MASPQATQVSRPIIMNFKSTSAVTIRVGKAPNAEDFIAHESFLTSRSEFFRRAMNGNWKEAETRIINLPDDEGKIFAHYINYVYTGQLATAIKTTEELKMLEVEDFRTYVREQYHDILSVFVLAEKLQDLATKNAMLEAALATSKLRGCDGKWRSPPFSAITAIYNGMPPGSPARRFVTDVWTALPVSDIFKSFEHLPKDFVRDLGGSMNEARPALLGNIALQKGIAAYQEKPKEV